MYDELRGNLMAQATHFSVHDETSLLLLKAADAIEDLQKQLQKSEVDNINLTGWLAEEHAKHLWIPVTERLPDSWGHYFVFIIGGECRQISWTTVAYFDGKIFRWEHLGQEHSEDVTHWMPLPEPPESGGE